MFSARWNFPHLKKSWIFPKFGAIIGAIGQLLFRRVVGFWFGAA